MKRAALVLALFIVVAIPLSGSSTDAQSTQSGSVGVEGTVPTEAPTTGATISTPTDGQTFTSLPVTVSGICPSGLLVKLFKNNVFSGSAQCDNGSYSIVIDLFNGRNDLVAKVYDALDQPGPDSNTVSVFFSDTNVSVGPRVSLTSSYAKRGANPNEKLSWPIILSGGSGPYAISVDWGDGTTADLMSQAFPGTFDISHTYAASGIYKVVVKATDNSSNAAFLQLTAVVNGPISQTSAPQYTEETVTTQRRIIWQPILIAIPLICLAFWLGRKHELFVLRHQVERRR